MPKLNTDRDHGGYRRGDRQRIVIAQGQREGEAEQANSDSRRKME